MVHHWQDEGLEPVPADKDIIEYHRGLDICQPHRFG
ncbi:hypothetical protein SAMN05878482_101291 [Peribacillus simplex]|uniref:Uncharacterized protein n=1 Tax=Peribacillus simplex TaxID=1478 RepID=A0A9X8WH29_9BACI|nr:hypothetical protein SAMN05878482_101291 [Peribacillus simplex]